MTLTEMLRNNLTLNNSPMAEHELSTIKGTFEEWLKTVGLPTYYSLNHDGHWFSTTESIRHLLIQLVDEP